MFTIWVVKGHPDRLGLLPMMLDTDDPRSATEQLHAAYSHGGGWRPFTGFTVKGGGDLPYRLAYPGDPDRKEIGRTLLRDEIVVLFESDWVMVVKSDGTHEIARMD
jgi:hypothetical protein